MWNRIFLFFLVVVCLGMAGFIAWDKVVVPQGWAALVMEKVMPRKNLDRREQEPLVATPAPFPGTEILLDEESSETQAVSEPVAVPSEPMPLAPVVEADTTSLEAQEEITPLEEAVAADPQPASPPSLPKEEPATTVQIFEPSLPKPMGVIPHGWKMEVIADHEAQSYPVPLPGGRVAEISSLPYEIKPSDRPGLYHIQDPGYDPRAGVNSPTVGKLLADSAEKTRELQLELEETLVLLQATLEQAEKEYKDRQSKSALAETTARP